MMGLNVLLVEDDANNARLLREAVKGHSSVRSFQQLEDPDGIVHYVRAKASEKPDLIFLDLKLPAGRTLELLRQIKSHEDTRVIPTVVFTPPESHAEVQEAYKRYANCCLLKPSLYHDLRSTVGAVLDFWCVFAVLAGFRNPVCRPDLG